MGMHGLTVASRIRLCSGLGINHQFPSITFECGLGSAKVLVVEKCFHFGKISLDYTKFRISVLPC